jgi:cell division septal protein FtsQ
MAVTFCRYITVDTSLINQNNLSATKLSYTNRPRVEMIDTPMRTTEEVDLLVAKGIVRLQATI